EPAVRTKRGNDREWHPDQQREQHAVADQRGARAHPLADDLSGRGVERERGAEVALQRARDVERELVPDRAVESELVAHARDLGWIRPPGKDNPHWIAGDEMDDEERRDEQ